MEFHAENLIRDNVVGIFFSATAANLYFEFRYWERKLAKFIAVNFPDV